MPSCSESESQQPRRVELRVFLPPEGLTISPPRNTLACRLCAPTVRFRLDLGFRVYADRSLPLMERPEGLRAGDVVELIVTAEENGRIHARVYDFARVSIYPDLVIDERFRLGRINTPEIFGVRRDGPEYIRGIATRDYVVARFAEHDGRMILGTSRRGRWRRWIAEVFVGDSTTRLSDELLREQHAVLWSRAPRREPRTGRLLGLSEELRDRIRTKADRLGLPPAELVERALTGYLE